MEQDDEPYSSSSPPPDDAVFHLISEDLDPSAFGESMHNQGAVKHHDLYMLRYDVLAASSLGELPSWCQYAGHDSDKHQQRLAEVSIARIVDSYMPIFHEYESLAQLYDSMLSAVEQSSDPDLPVWIETKEQLRDLWERAVDMQMHVSQLRERHGIKLDDHVDDATFNELTAVVKQYIEAKKTIGQECRSDSGDSEETPAAVGAVSQELLALL